MPVARGGIGGVSMNCEYWSHDDQGKPIMPKMANLTERQPKWFSVGKLADLAILSANPPVVRRDTIMDGVTVYPEAVSH